jgi:hypothetical protein
MIRANNGPVTDPALIVTLCAAAAGGTLAGRTVVTVDARASGVIAAVPPGTWTAGVAGLALVALALVDAPAGAGLLAAVALAVGTFAVGFLRGAVRIVVAEERRERPTVRIAARRRTASRRRRAA